MAATTIEIRLHDPADLLAAVTSALHEGESTWLTLDGERRAVIAPAPQLPLTRPGELAYEGEARYADGTRVSLQCFEARHGECPDETTDDNDADGPLDGGYRCECACEHGPASERSAPDSALLLCDGCYQAATGLLAQCAEGCAHDLDHTGQCVRRGREDCEWCGRSDRLHQVNRAEVLPSLPTVGEEDEGQWFLHWPADRGGPYPSSQAAWDAWHDSTRPGQPVPRPASPATGAPGRGEDRPPCADHGGPPHRHDSDGEPGF